MGPLTGKTAIVTGSGRGIGRAVVEGLVSHGAKVGANTLTQKSMNSILTFAERMGFGESIYPLVGDASDPAFARRAVDSTIRRYKGLDILVNNVGVGLPKAAIKVSLSEWDRTMQVNLRTTFLWSRLAALQFLKTKRGGSIVNISSNLALRGRKERVAYITSKAGILGMTRALAAEWGPATIRVNAVAPGTTRTDRMEDIIKQGKATEADYVQRIPLGRIGSPQEIAQAVLFLVSDDSRFINGATLVVDGGADASG